jgi:hypothetical protein
MSKRHQIRRLKGMPKNHSRLSAATCAAVLTLACERGPLLVPAAGASRPRDVPGAVMAVQNQVRVIVQAREWPGPARIAEVITPLRIMIENGSRQPLQIRYSGFKVVGPRGEIYRAIPPRRVTGVVDTEEYIRPGFTYGRFYAAPYYRGYYSGVPAYSGDFPLDEPYHQLYDGYWDGRAILPTPEVIARALPEGVLNPGGRLDGYVYFEKPEQERGSGVDVRVDLKPTGDSAAPSITMRLPFVLDHTPHP